MIDETIDKATPRHGQVSEPLNFGANSFELQRDHRQFAVCRTIQDANVIRAAVNARDALLAERDRLRKALTEAIDIIHQEHSEPGWDIYYTHSPEMLRLRAALGEVKNKGETDVE